MIKHVFGSYVLPFGLCGLGIIMPENTVIKIWIGHGCFVIAGLIFFWAIFKDIKNYFQKRKNVAIKEEQLPQNPSKYNIIDDCIQDENAGWLRNTATDEIFCLKCWYGYHVKTPLIKDKSVPAGWICPKCKKQYTSLSRAFNRSAIVRFFDSDIEHKPKKKSLLSYKTSAFGGGPKEV